MPRGVFMRLSKLIAISAFVVFFVSAVFAAAGDSAAPPILPKQFGGWQMQGSPQPSKDAAVADPTNAALLKEYGFKDFESATYKSDDGRTLKVRAARFADASGAFGAYTFYLQSGMAREEIGDQGASADRRVLFYRGHVVVDAVFNELSVMSAASLRELGGSTAAAWRQCREPAADSRLHAASRIPGEYGKIRRRTSRPECDRVPDSCQSHRFQHQP